MDNQDQPKWYFKTWPLVVSFFCVGPFMLPLVWANPRLTKKSKIIITLVVVGVTYIMTKLLVISLKTITGYYQVPLDI